MKKQELIDKYGMTEEVASKIEADLMEGMKDFVPKSRLDQEIEKTKAERTRADGLQTSLKELEDYKGTTEGMQAKLDELKTTREQEKKQYEESIDRIAKRNAVTLKLLSKETRPIDKAMNTLLEAYDFSKIKLDKDGNIVDGFDEQDANITENMSFCYPAPEKGAKIKVSGSTPPDGDKSDTPKQAEAMMAKLLNQLPNQN
jgi:hypothetical protein